jgi:hypothetical protein
MRGVVRSRPKCQATRQLFDGGKHPRGGFTCGDHVVARRGREIERAADERRRINGAERRCEDAFEVFADQ